MPTKQRHRIFAYGTLVIPQVLEALTGRSFPATDATLHGHARFLVKDECYPALVPMADRSTPGRLYLHVDDKTLDLLDRFEGESYVRRTVLVQTEIGGTLEAQTFLLSPGREDLRTSSPWDEERFRREDVEGFLERCRKFRAQAAD